MTRALSWVALGLLFAASGPSADNTSATAAGHTDGSLGLVVEAAGFSNNRGHAMAMLFRPGANVLSKKAAYRIVSGDILGKKARLEFPALPEGDYALVVFHDENDNAVVDHNFLGLPSEQLGFSNGFRPGLLSGMPSFEKLRFKLARPGNPFGLAISVK